MSLIRICIVVLFLLCLITDATAQGMESIKQESEVTARGVLDSALGGSLGENRGAELQQIIGYEKDAPIEGQGMALEQAESLGSHKRQKTHEDAGRYKCDKSECEVSHSFSTTETLKRETSIEEAGFVRDENGQIKNNKGYMDKALETVKSAGDKFDFITGGYADCVADNEIEKNTTEKTCDEYYDRKEKSCFARQVVEIDPKYTYICNKKKEVREKTCETIIQVTSCSQKELIDVPFTTVAEAKVVDDGRRTINGNWLVLNLSGAYLNVTNFLGGALNSGKWNCKDINASFTLNIGNIDEIAALKISNYEIQGYLVLTVNGQVAFTSPGSKPNYVGTAVYYYQGNPDINIKQFLKTGTNNLTLTITACSYGKFGLQLHALKHQCNKWEESQEERCS